MAMVWICGRIVPDKEHNWELVGVFSTEKKAVDAATLPVDWVATMKLDERQRDESFVIPGAYFPRNPNDPKYVGDPNG